VDNRQISMITNYYTLFHVAAELHQTFAGRMIEEVFTQHKGELVISFREIPAVILIGCEPSNNYMYSRNIFSRARRNSVDIFPKIPGSLIEKIFIHPADRQIHIQLNVGCELVVQLFGSKANIFFTDASGMIIDTFLKKIDLKSVKLEMSSGQHSQEIFNMSSADIQNIYKGQSLVSVMKKLFPRFGPFLVEELLTRLGWESVRLVDSLLDSEFDCLLAGAKQLSEELLSSPSTRLYYNGNSPVRLSVIPLHYLRELEFQQYDSLSEAIHVFRATVRREKAALQEKEEILKVLERGRVQTERTFQKMTMEEDVPNRAEQYEKFGKLLIANLHLIKKGDSTALAEDFVSGTHELLEIVIDPHLAPAKNAGRYFEKAEKSRRAAEEQRHRAAELAKQNKLITQLLDRIEDVVTTDDLHKFFEDNQKELSQFGLKLKKTGQVKKEEPLPFRVFTVAGGFEVWAGKSSENNDVLSTRHTAKNDLWFHARGVGGSHVVLKVGTGKGEVSKQAIEQAAAIAAYYSKMKNSKLVPVAMCEGKYVRKPKGVPPGTVTLEREKTLFVEPALPHT
jgi:predicted ribosome quality control (RQC) complex YloA/Tae2 family protein